MKVKNKKHYEFYMLKTFKVLGIYGLRKLLGVFILFILSLGIHIQLIAQNSFIDKPNFEPFKSESEELTSEEEQDENFSQVINIEQLQLYSDRTIEEAMARILGVQMARRGQFNIRGISGVGRGLYNVTIDGQRMATTGKGNRSIDLGSISVDLIHQLEVSRVLTPDKDADALGGLINIKTRRPVGQHRQLDIIYGGGFNSRYGDFISPDSRASIHYSEGFGEDLTISAGLTHQLNNFAWENLNIDYDVTDFGSGNVDVINSISPGLYTNERNNWGGRFELNYQPTKETSYFVTSYFNNSLQDIIRHRLMMSANGDWINQLETGDTGRQGSYGYDINMQDQRVRQVLAQAGAKHRMSAMTLESSLGWSHSNLHENQILLPFLLSGLDYNISMNDQSRPTMEPINGPISNSDLRIEPMNEIIQRHTDNSLTGNIDINIPFAAGFFQFGTGAVLSNKDGDYRNSFLRVAGLMDLSRFQLMEGKSISILENSDYEIPSLIKPNRARQFVERNQTNFRRDLGMQRENSDIWNYEAKEGIYSGYGMVSLDVSLFNIMGGARVEHTDARYGGNIVMFDDIGSYISTSDTTVTNSYTKFYPSLQLKMAPTQQSNIMLAYSRSIARPDFHNLTPFRLIHEQNMTVFRGNPKLDPMISDNLDLFMEQNFLNIGQLGFGLFYKKISNFVLERIRIIEGGEFDGYLERSFEIGDETADIYGIEVSWYQNFGFLPGVFSNFRTYTNYTWSHSNFNVDPQNDMVRLPGQSPHVVNTALNYIQGRFKGRVAYHWTAKSIMHLTDTSSGPTDQVRYEDGGSDLSASIRFRISENFQVWTDATNLLKDERIQFSNSRSLYPYDSDFRRSTAFRIGLRFDL